MITESTIDAINRSKVPSKEDLDNQFNTTNSKIDTIIGYWGKVQWDTLSYIKINLANTEILQPVQKGSTWKRAITLLASGARTASGTGSTIPVDDIIGMDICIAVTAVSGTTPALTVYIEGEDEITGNWKTLWSNSTAYSAVTVDWAEIEPLRFRNIRVRWVISGTSPSFTFSVTAQAYTG